MKILKGIVAGILTLGLLLSPAVPRAETAKGMIKAVDAKARTITFSREGQSGSEVLPVDASVDLRKLKKYTKARVEIDGGVVKEIHPEKASAAGY